MKKILLIDDDHVSNFINQKIIQRSGISSEIIVCKSGRCGLDILDNLMNAETAGPEIILLDINMPIMDGFGFLDEFKKYPPAFIQDIKIVMLTSSLNESDKIRSLEYDCVVDFFNKPLSQDKLIELGKFVSC